MPGKNQDAYAQTNIKIMEYLNKALEEEELKQSLLVRIVDLVLRSNNFSEEVFYGISNKIIKELEAGTTYNT